VLVRLPNSIDYPTAFLGAMKRGAIAVPTSTLLTAEEVRYLLEDSRRGAMVIDRPAGKRCAPRSRAPRLRARDLAGEPLDGALAGVATSSRRAHARRRSGLPRLHLRHHGYPKGVLHGAPLAHRPRARSDYWFDFAPKRRRPHRALGQVQLDLRAGLGADGSALSRQDGDRARGPQRRRHLAAPHRQARRHDLHRRADDLPPDPAEDRGRAGDRSRRCGTA
jgi:hypothetical protein